MAEIKVEKKKGTSAVTWLIILLVIVAAVILFLDYTEDIAFIDLL